MKERRFREPCGNNGNYLLSVKREGLPSRQASPSHICPEQRRGGLKMAKKHASGRRNQSHMC
jgi:hypothetical protein